MSRAFLKLHAVSDPAQAPETKRQRKNPPTFVPCSLCSANAAYAKRTNQAHEKNGQWVIVTNVEIFGCDNCGGSYFKSAALKAVDEVLAHSEQYGEYQQVRVALFPESIARAAHLFGLLRFASRTSSGSFPESMTLADAIKFARIARLDDAVVGS